MISTAPHKESNRQANAKANAARARAPKAGASESGDVSDSSTIKSTLPAPVLPNLAKGKGKAKATMEPPPPVEQEEDTDSEEERFLALNLAQFHQQELPMPPSAQPETKPDDAEFPVDPQFAPQTVLYGCGDRSTIPPAFPDLYTTLFTWVQHSFNRSMRKVAEEENELQSSFPYEARSGNNKALALRQDYSDKTLKKAALLVFGAHVIIERGGVYTYATGPPGGPEIDHYADRCKTFVNGLKYAFKRNDANHLTSILTLDSTYVASKFPGSDKFMSENKYTSSKIKKWLPDVVAGCAKYKHHGASMSTWFTNFVRKFWISASALGDTPTSLNQGLSTEMLQSIQQAVEECRKAQEQEQIDDSEFQQARAVAESVALAGTARGPNGDLTEGPEFTIGDVLSDGDLGVSMFRGWDAWQFVEYFGIEHIQSKRVIKLASRLTIEECHERKKDTNGKYLKDNNGDYIWVYPKHHQARSEIVWPGLKAWDDEPINRDLWLSTIEHHVANGLPPAVPTRDTHTRLCPTVHQLSGVANIIARGYLDPQAAPFHSHSIICDDVGVGKTLQGIMIMTIINFYKGFNQGRDYLENPAPVMAPFKADWSSASGSDKKPWTEE